MIFLSQISTVKAETKNDQGLLINDNEVLNEPINENDQIEQTVEIEDESSKVFSNDKTTVDSNTSYTETQLTPIGEDSSKIVSEKIENEDVFSWKLEDDGTLVIGGGIWPGGVPWWSVREQVLKVNITSKIISSPSSNAGFSGMFRGCSNLVSIDGIELLDTSNARSLTSMFQDCSKLKSLDLSSMNTLNVTNMSYMFSGCSSLSNLNVESFDTIRVTYTSNMFRNCYSLSSINIENFNTNNTTDMSSMFAGCNNLIELDLSNFSTSKVTNMSGMFQNASKISSLDISSFDTSSVKDMSYMFFGLRELDELNLSNFKVDNVIDFTSCFQGMIEIEELDLKNFETATTSTYVQMFKGLNNLKKLDIRQMKFSSDENLTMYLFQDTLPEELTLGPESKLNTFMRLPLLTSNFVWVDIFTNEITSEELIQYHNEINETNTYHVEEQYELIFNTLGGCIISSQRSIAGKYWSKPDEPKKEGLMFDKWMANPELTEEFDFTKAIEKSQTIYASYIPAYMINIPAKLDLAISNSLPISVENYLSDKRLNIYAPEELILTNTKDSLLKIKRDLTTDYEESELALTQNGIGSKENTLVLNSANNDFEAAGSYKGIINFQIVYE